MYSEWYKEQLEAVLNYATYYNLDSRSVYKLLASYGVDEGTKGMDQTNLKNRCAAYAENLISKYLNSGKRIIPRVEDQGHHFRHINVTFDEEKNRGVRDVIKLYIPIKSTGLETGTRLIYDFLFQNGINFQSKISGTERAEMFVLRVDTKEDAEKVINFCSSRTEIYGNYSVTNPCMPHVNGIGIGKDTYRRSYNEFISECISEYALNPNSKNNTNHTTKFMEHLKSKYTYANTSQDKYMSATAIQNMLAITGDANILDSYSDSYNYEFDPNFFYSYKRFRDANGYFYKDGNGNVINMQTNPSLFISLQAQNCLHKIYTEVYSTETEKIVPKQRFRLSDSETNKMSNTLDHMLDASGGPIRGFPIKNNYRMEEIAMLYPYLYADFARVHKYTNPNECMEIVNVVKNYLQSSYQR